MAGHNPPTILLDPALVKYASMSVNRYKYFRWTPRTFGLTLLYVAIIPFGIGYVAYKTDGKWDMRGKRKGDTVSEF
ncbi:hypothetical protein P152DRAFT_459449 [Eremomyces bilateralis CBS 781.70]|uniref:Complex I-B15 n=1 Tax=Eremomyces bilateralis CBS 781.70 TaxID=1392243 RepID=A0A6G1G067_9PEZI|nr:uncharacterized protein P152DRAFT_459449 [Eremomyces bilateralis CBS 781.70]KAF1811507.1 hypothetical protein P152DRAFT_459449 [Eremomyces bilateralis CBS 781.70]